MTIWAELVVCAMIHQPRRNPTDVNRMSDFRILQDENNTRPQRNENVAALCLLLLF
ncbi:MAG: hypothetical protein IKM35_01835 [Bacteroidaceae bacterium]|nr:hypothetical protein [Bacteroidaceae bacterium]